VESTVGSVLVHVDVIHNGGGLLHSGKWYVPQIVLFAPNSFANFFAVV
jgi:hypothetical protein